MQVMLIVPLVCNSQGMRVQPMSKHTSCERVDRYIKPAVLKTEAQIHSNGIAQSRLSLGIKITIQQ